MKKIAKIFLVAIACIVAITALAGCLSEDSEAGGNQPNEAQNQSSDEAAGGGEDAPANQPLTAQRPDAAPLESSGNLGRYHVDIGDYTLEKDYNGRQAIVVSYTFTNNDDEAQSATFAVSEKAFQNGVSLEPAIFADDSIVDSSANMRDVQPGASLEIKQGYLLSSPTAPVEFEVTEAISFNDDMLGKTFEIDPSGKTEYPSAPVGATNGNLGNYEVSVVSCEIGDNYDDTDVLIVHYGFTNNGKKEASFSLEISAKVFQNGVELERAYFADINESGTLFVKPGAGIEVVEAYELPDTSSAVNIELSEIFSLSDEKITAAVELK